mmetsp:Transcript_35662/g.106413  ORF Transcript_35662/g.106413 Transcript_35662/m.106413 type:complete len:138 (-) Transcript_35662:2264-2677(-)
MRKFAQALLCHVTTLHWQCLLPEAPAATCRHVKHAKLEIKLLINTFHCSTCIYCDQSPSRIDMKRRSTKTVISVCHFFYSVSVVFRVRISAEITADVAFSDDLFLISVTRTLCVSCVLINCLRSSLIFTSGGTVLIT